MAGVGVAAASVLFCDGVLSGVAAVTHGTVQGDLIYGSTSLLPAAHTIACMCDCRAWREGFTITLVSGRTVGIGAYLARLGRRCVQRTDQPIILTGYSALNKVLGRQVRPCAGSKRCVWGARGHRRGRHCGKHCLWHMCSSPF
jgi:hypothetical protein